MELQRKKNVVGRRIGGNGDGDDKKRGFDDVPPPFRGLPDTTGSAGGDSFEETLSPFVKNGKSPQPLDLESPIDELLDFELPVVQH